MSSWIERVAGRLPPALGALPPPGRKCAAVAAVVHDEPGSSDGPRVLLMRRTERAGDPWSGHVSLPGGRHEPSDPDLLATAIRETHEELGVQLAGARLLGRLPTLSPLTAGPRGIEVTPFVFATDRALDAQPSEEAASAFWLPIELATSGKLDATFTYPGTERTFPSWSFDGHVIWGLTWRILGDLFAAARS